MGGGGELWRRAGDGGGGGERERGVVEGGGREGNDYTKTGVNK